MVKRRFRHFYEKNFDIFEIYNKENFMSKTEFALAKKFEQEIAKQKIFVSFYVQ